MSIGSRLRDLFGTRRPQPEGGQAASLPIVPPSVIGSSVDLAPDDPLIGYLQTAAGAIELDQIDVDSDGVRALKETGVTLVVPLTSQGELVGLLNLGPRLGQQEYSSDDRRLLAELAVQVAPAVRVGELVRQQEREVQAREQIERELRVARLIQQTLLPHELPSIDGWEVSAYYRPAREVGGDFYDFIDLDDGKLGIVVADVTDKGVPAALVMATARSVLRSAATALVSPAQVLKRANDLLHSDIPPKMFVTCLYVVLDPATGSIQFANAGHNLPFRHASASAASGELTASGMPLGLMPDMSYEEYESSLSPGESLLLYTDGLVEAHDPQGAMFGFPRLRQLAAEHPGGAALIPHLLDQLEDHTGPGWEQEDDVTLVTLQRAPSTGSAPQSKDSWHTLAEFTVASREGNERLAIAQVEQAVAPLAEPQARVDRLKTAVGEATMNAMEHGNEYREELDVEVRVACSDQQISVRIIDHGEGPAIHEPNPPDLLAKLEGKETPRGWGLFLIRSLVDDVRVASYGNRHVVELILKREGGSHAG